jgi:hypothetical protein
MVEPFAIPGRPVYPNTPGKNIQGMMLALLDISTHRSIAYKSPRVICGQATQLGNFFRVNSRREGETIDKIRCRRGGVRGIDGTPILKDVM